MIIALYGGTAYKDMPLWGWLVVIAAFAVVLFTMARRR